MRETAPGEDDRWLVELAHCMAHEKCSDSDYVLLAERNAWAMAHEKCSDSDYVPHLFDQGQMAVSAKRLTSTVSESSPGL